ncbi:MAG: hypothetical protein AAF170_01435 [Bacteroidota bacterium]
MRSTLALASLLLLAACSGSPPEAPAPADALLDLWAAIPVGMDALTENDVPETCDVSFKTWFEDFGVRGLACATNQGLSLREAPQRAPMRVWTSGPHQLDANGLALDLTAERAFGQYNPAFVEWAVANGLPRTEGAQRIAQPVYDRYVRRLARVYWLVLSDLEADGFPASLPAGAVSEYAAYLEGGAIPDGTLGFEGGVSMHSLFGDLTLPLAQRLRSPTNDEWSIRYEANTAYGFWVRRRADGSVETFRDGLSELLQTLDSEWLAAN